MTHPLTDTMFQAVPEYASSHAGMSTKAKIAMAVVFLEDGSPSTALSLLQSAAKDVGEIIRLRDEMKEPA